MRHTYASCSESGNRQHVSPYSCVCCAREMARRGWGTACDSVVMVHVVWTREKGGT